MPKTFVVEQTYHFHVSPGKVFAALTEPKLLVKWILSEARLEPKKGGAFTFCWKAGYRMEGKVLQYSRGKSVSLLWVDKFPGRKVVKTSAKFRVVSKGRGALLKLRHTGFSAPDHYAACSAGWAYFLTNLKSVLEHGFDLRSSLDA